MIPATSAEPEQVLTAEQAAELSIASPALHRACRTRPLFYARVFRSLGVHAPEMLGASTEWLLTI